MSNEPVNRTFAGRPARVLRAGYGRITSNAGSGAYEITELHWDGSADQDGTAPGWLDEATVRDFQNRDTGAEYDVVRWWKQYKQDGSVEICIDIATAVGLEMFTQHRLRVAPTAGAGSVTIDTRDWRDRLVHYEMIGLFHVPPAPQADGDYRYDTSTTAGVHDTMWFGSSVTILGWNTVNSVVDDTPAASGWTCRLQINDPNGNLRLDYDAGAALLDASYVVVRVMSGPAQTTNDTNAT